MEDKQKYKSQGTTSSGIAPCYRDKYARIGKQVKDDVFFKEYLWDEQLYGNILCGGHSYNQTNKDYCFTIIHMTTFEILVDK